MMVQALVTQIPSLTESIARYDQQIAALFSQHDDSTLFGSFPGAGSALAPRLLAAFGSNRDRFEYAAEIQKLSGIAPVTEKSGTSLWVHWRLACSKFLRQTFHEFAAQSVSQSPWARRLLPATAAARKLSSRRFARSGFQMDSYHVSLLENRTPHMTKPFTATVSMSASLPWLQSSQPMGNWH